MTPQGGNPVQAVTEFYRALSGADRERVNELCLRWFSDDIVLTFPRSLPFGGQVKGADRLRRMFTAMCAGPPPTGPRDLRLTGVWGTTDPTGAVVAEMGFDYLTPGGELISSGALELWRFADGQVRAIDAYYQDTAALLGTG